MTTDLEALLPRSMYTNDYRRWDPQPRVKLGPRPVIKLKERPSHRSRQIDLETMIPFKPGVNLPFSLLHRKKKVIQINPHDPIPDVKLEDKMFELKLKARRERPKVFMVPQIDLDDVPEDVMYGEKGKGGLADSIYSSDWKKASDYVIKNSPLNRPGHSNEKIVYKKEDIIRTGQSVTCRPPNVVQPLEIGLAKFVDKWEKSNPVEFVDTTKTFWESHPEIGMCSICEPQPAAKGMTEEESVELEKCLNEHVLRTPYTLHLPGYTGYVPRLALGIPFRKKLFTKYDTFLTTLMENQGVYKK